MRQFPNVSISPWRLPYATGGATGATGATGGKNFYSNLNSPPQPLYRRPPPPVFYHPGVEQVVGESDDDDDSEEGTL